MTEFRHGPPRSISLIRAKYFRVSEAAESLPFARRSWSWGIVSSSRTKDFGLGAFGGEAENAEAEGMKAAEELKTAPPKPAVFKKDRRFIIRGFWSIP